MKAGLSIVVPLYNEARGLARLHAQLAEAAQRLAPRGLAVEVVYVDDGSADDTLVIASSHKTVARRLRVPGVHLGEVRHFLRDKIGEHAIEFDAGPGLHLGTRDTRESV